MALRGDKPGHEIIRELPLPQAALAQVQRDGMSATSFSPVKLSPESDKKQGATKTKRATNLEVQIAGVSLSHSSRVLFPGSGWTKLDLARYYEQIADSYIIGNIRGRLQHRGDDPWIEYFTLKQRITAAMARQYGI